MKTIGKRKWAFLWMALFVSSAVFAESYDVNVASSKVSWLGKKVTGQHHGSINVKEGTLTVDDDEITGGTVLIDMQSIENEDLTNEEFNKKLVGHLKSDDFFGVESYPTARLVLTDVKKSGDEYTFTGDLTIKGITHPVTFKGTSESDAGTVKVNGTMTIDRSKYNIKYGSSSFFDNLGDKMIYDEFTLDFELVAEK